MKLNVSFFTPRLALVLTVLFGLAACGGDGMDDLRAFVEKEKAKPGGRIEPLPEIKPYETYVYVPGARREPFTASQESRPAAVAGAGAGTGVQPDRNRSREALEGFPLDTLRMVGTLQKEGGVAALIRAQDGTIHRITAGNYLGQNHGKVTLVSEEKVELTEIVPDGSGGWLERQASVALSE